MINMKTLMYGFIIGLIGSLLLFVIELSYTILHGYNLYICIFIAFNIFVFIFSLYNIIDIYRNY